MFRYRLLPTPAQEAALRGHCAHARYVWNLAVEQHAHWRPGRARPAGRPSWRTAGRHEGFRIVGRHRRQWDVRRLSRKTGEHVAFAAIPDPIPAPGTGEVAGIVRGVAVSAALSTGELLHAPSLTALERRRMRRLEDKAPGRVEKVNPAFTSQRCSACGHVAAESRKSQALFACVACSFACNADVNAARNIAAGHAATARGGDGAARPVNREPQLLLLPA